MIGTTISVRHSSGRMSAGFPPDFRVYPGIQDILSGRDPQMDFAIRLIEEGK